MRATCMAIGLLLIVPSVSLAQTGTILDPPQDFDITLINQDHNALVSVGQAGNYFLIYEIKDASGNWSSLKTAYFSTTGAGQKVVAVGNLGQLPEGVTRDGKVRLFKWNMGTPHNFLYEVNGEFHGP